ncbi:uridine phosphorylase [Hydrogenoanaerobacterium sp.]|uniref:uridine phosphorylase n=1 Tax=Hydrogenoanaerobacterium sp. TaxID=2953763 RepID=UPI002898F2C5|nr:uridine phosphorylase [Hydrogenoanaerobacterium sp.]
MEKELMHHIKCGVGDVGRYVILPGDPGRVEKIAAYLDNAEHVTTYREYNTWTGYLEGVKVSVCSTGIGGPSASIAVEELIKCGADTFIRVGTCGGMDPTLIPGDLIVATGAIRKEGTGREYVPIEYPAVANYELLTALDQAATNLGKTHHMGVVECKDSYYGQHDPDSMPTGDELKGKWKAWKMAGALGSEMESATLFIVAAARRVRAATVLLLCRNREREALYNKTETSWDTAPAIETAIEALRITIRKDKEKENNA